MKKILVLCAAAGVAAILAACAAPLFAGESAPPRDFSRGLSVGSEAPDFTLPDDEHQRPPVDPAELAKSLEWGELDKTINLV